MQGNALFSFLYRHRLSLIFVAIYAFLSVYVMLHFLHNSRLGDEYYRMRFERMIEGTAWKPFTYRILIPKLTVLITDMTPASLQERVTQQFDQALQESYLVRDRFPWLYAVYKNLTYERLVTTVLVYMCLWGYILALYHFARVLFPNESAIHYFAPIFGLFIPPSFSWPFAYIYDIPVLFLSTACYWCMVRQRFATYLIFFTLACVNKESSVFIGIVFFLWFCRRMDKRQFFILLFSQILIYTVIRLNLYLLFMENRGPFLEENFVKLMKNDIFMKSKYFQIVAISVMFFMLTFDWKKKPLFLKQSLWVLIPFYAAYVLHGRAQEYRVFFDVMPLLTMLLTHTLISSTGISKSPVFAHDLPTQETPGTS